MLCQALFPPASALLIGVTLLRHSENSEDKKHYTAKKRRANSQAERNEFGSEFNFHVSLLQDAFAGGASSGHGGRN